MSTGISSRRSRSGGSADRDDVQAEVEVLAELARRRRPRSRSRLVAAMTRTSTWTSCLAAEPRELAVLQHLQQLGLQRKASSSPISSRNIVPWLANSNLPGLCWIAPVNAPRSKPNSSDSSSSVGQRGAVHLHERLVAPARRGVERARDQLLAGAALAANQHRDVGVGDALDQLAHLGHPLAVAEEQRVTALRLQLLAQRRDFAAELPLRQRVGERHFEVGFVERLADEIGRAELHRLHDRRRCGPGPTAR